MPSNAPSRGPISNRKPSGTTQLNYQPRGPLEPTWQLVAKTGVVKNTLVDQTRSLGESHARVLSWQGPASADGRVTAFH